MIAGLLLAAGGARRFGAPKLIHHFRGTPIVRWSAEALAAATDALFVVVPSDPGPLREALHGIPARIVVNPEPARGLGRSIACGVGALPPDVDAVIIALADEPLADRAWTNAVIARYRAEERKAIVTSMFRGIRRHPILFDRIVFPELMQLDGDRGARAVVERDPTRVAVVEFNEPGTIDVDSPEDLARLEQAAQFRGPSLRPTSS